MPEEQVGMHLWRLMRLGYPQRCLVPVVDAIRNLPWGTGGVEQQHAAAAQVHKMHGLMQSDMVRCRAMAFFMRSQLSCSASALRVGALEGRIAATKKRCPQRVNGKCIYLREAFKTWKELNCGKAMSTEVRQEIVRKAGLHYAALAPAVREGYEHRARSEGSQRASELRDLVHDLEVQIDLERGRDQQHDRDCNPWTASACAFSDVEKSAFVDFCASHSMSYREAAALRDKVQDAPGADPALKLAFQHFPVEGPPRLVPAPWVGMVADRREHFARTVFIVDEGTDIANSFYMFGFAYQSPRTIAWVKLERCSSGLRGGDDEFIFSAAADEFWDYNFSVMWTYAFSFDGACEWDLDDIKILTDLVHLKSGQCATHASDRLHTSDLAGHELLVRYDLLLDVLQQPQTYLR